jgi:hypothetical protein
VHKTLTGVRAMRYTGYILTTWTTTRVVLHLNSYGQGPVKLIAVEAGTRNIHGEIAKADREMNGRVSYDSQSALGEVSASVKG